MLKLRILLLRNSLYYVLLFLAIAYFLLANFCLNYTSKYNNISIIEAKIVDIKVNDYGIKLTLLGKEKFLGYYYLEDDKIQEFKSSYSLGDIVKIDVIEMDITNNTVFNTFNYKKYLYYNKIYKVFEITKIEMVKENKNLFYKAKDIILKRSYKLTNSYNYINTLLFGDSSSVSSDVLDSYRENGISHLFAISGLHVNIFIMLLDNLLKKLKVKEEKRTIFTIIFLLIFMFLTNYSMSVMRSCIFSSLLLINKLFYFNIRPINLLLLTLSIIMFLNPFNIYNIGLQYSFFISLSLLITSNYINTKNSYIKKLLVTSFISFVVSLPITIYNFYQINLLSIIYNLFFVPYVSYLVLPLTIVSYFLPFFDKILHILIIIMENLSLFLCKIDLLKIIICKPNLSIYFLYYGLIFLFLIGLRTSRKKYLYPVFILLFLNIIWPFSKYDKLTFIDVGQGDSILLNVNFTSTLIDTGGVNYVKDGQYTYKISKNKTIPYLKSLGIRKLDNLILTHGDSDHMQEAIYLVENFKVKQVIFNNGTYNYLEQELIAILNKKHIPYYQNIRTLDIKDIKLYFLNNKLYNNENDNSNVIYTKINDIKILLMGDASTVVEKDLLTNKMLKNIDILKVGHHGSKTSSGIEFINKTKPIYSIISVGKNNKFGHPTKEVLKNLENSKIYRTDQDGSVMFKFRKNNLEIKTCKP